MTSLPRLLAEPRHLEYFSVDGPKTPKCLSIRVRNPDGNPLGFLSLAIFCDLLGLKYVVYAIKDADWAELERRLKGAQDRVEAQFVLSCRPPDDVCIPLLELKDDLIFFGLPILQYIAQAYAPEYLPINIESLTTITSIDAVLNHLISGSPSPQAIEEALGRIYGLLPAIRTDALSIIDIYLYPRLVFLAKDSSHKDLQAYLHNIKTLLPPSCLALLARHV